MIAVAVDLLFPPVQTTPRILTALLAIVFAGCARGDQRSPAESTVTVLYPFDEGVLGPCYGMEARHLIFLSLAGLPGDASGEERPRLAERWEHSPDYRIWTYHLRRDLQWHDGVPVTADDVAFTIGLWEQVAPIRPPGLDSAQVIDAHTVRVYYDRPTNGVDTYHVYFPKHLLETENPAEICSWAFWSRPVGNGPFRYVRHVPKTMVELAANPDHYAGKPRLDRVILRFGSQENWVAELKSENADAVNYIDRVDVLKLGDDPRFRAYHWWGGWVDAVYWNHRDPRFADRRVREALTRAVNREELGRLLNYPSDIPVYDGPCSARLRRARRCPSPLAYDTTAARRLLRDAGWSDARPLRFTVLVAADRPTGRAAVYLQEQFSRIGVRVEIETVEFSVLRQRLASGRFEAAIDRFRNANDFVASGVGAIVGAGSSIGWSHAGAARLAAREMEVVAPAARDSVHLELARLFGTELPVTFLLPQVQTHVVHRRVRGLEDLYRADPIWFMEELWIEERE